MRELTRAVPELSASKSPASAASRRSSSARSRRTRPSRTSRTSPAFDEVDVLANRYLDEYITGKLDRLDVVYTKFLSSSPAGRGGRNAAAAGLRSTGLAEARQPGSQTAAIACTSSCRRPRAFWKRSCPTSFKVKLFKCFLDAAVSEQIARMVAMKAATENADEMIQQLSMTYNRARQGADHRRIDGDHRRRRGAEVVNRRWSTR